MRGSGTPGLERQAAEVDGRRIVYGVAGEGPPLVLVHGLSASSRWWARNVAVLARQFRVYTVDLPGFGDNRQPGMIALDAMAIWLLRWMDAAGIEKASIAGHSMGGFVAANLAAMAPERVERLVLVDPLVRPFARPYREPVTRLIAELRHTPRGFLPTLLGDAARAGVQTVRRTAHAVVRADLRPRLAEVQAPTLVIWGARDDLVPPEVAEDVVGAIPDCRLVVIDGAGHAPMWEQPEAFNRVVLDFLGQAGPAERAGVGDRWRRQGDPGAGCG